MGQKISEMTDVGAGAVGSDELELSRSSSSTSYRISLTRLAAYIAASWVNIVASGTGTFGGALSAASAAITGAITAASSTLTGTLTAAAATLSGALTAASATISGTLTTAGFTATGTSSIAVPAWTAPTLTGSWVNVGGTAQVAGYYKDPTGRVWLRGQVANGTINGTNIFTLPAGFRPTKITRLAVAGFDIYTSLVIGTDGTVLADVGNNSRVCLDGASFLTT